MDYKPNSNRFKEQQKDDALEKKEIKRVTTGKVKTKKKSSIQKMAGAMFAEDMDNVKSYILMDVLIPALTNTVSDVLKKSIDAVFGRKSSSSNSRSSKISYRSYYDDSESRSSSSSSRHRGVYDYDDIIFDSRVEAEEVLERMEELIAKYDNVSVLEYYDLAGVSSEHTSNKFGWTDIHTAKVVRVSGDGYMIKLPRVTPL